MLYKLVFLTITSFLLSAVTLCYGQPLMVVHTKDAYRKLVKAEGIQKMVNLQKFIPSLVLDLQYADTVNFTRQKLYSSGDRTFLRAPAAEALKRVQEELEESGFGLKVWDAYRPYSVTRKMWDLIQDERYVANPAKGSNHNRGLAVDLTLLENGIEVDMGTGFDNFSDTAHHDFRQLPEQVLEHRKLLKVTMEKYGFKSLDTEWWHYSYTHPARFDVLDLSFKHLR